MLSNVTFMNIENHVKKRVIDKLAVASSVAAENALSTVNKWIASPRDPVNPGLWYSTFKAVMRRDGTYANWRKSYNFANDLLEPLVDKIDSQWDLVFNVKINDHFKHAVEESEQKVEHFTKTFETLLTNKGASEKTKYTFAEQVLRFSKSVVGLLLKARRSIQKEQKEANRLFASRIETDMKPIYAILAEESGTGAYLRMKDQLRLHVESQGQSMFDQAVDSVRTELERMLVEIKGVFDHELEELCCSFQLDCVRIVSMNAKEFLRLDEAYQRTILTALGEAEVSFQAITKSLEEDDVTEPALQNAGNGDSELVADVDDTTGGLEELDVQDEWEGEMEWSEEEGAELWEF